MIAEPLKPCQCGKVPKNVWIEHRDSTAHVVPSCCNFWRVYVRPADRYIRQPSELWNAAPRPTALEGWRSVPVEPTQAEIDAGINELCATDLLQEGYANVIKRIRKAMLAAIPAPDEEMARLEELVRLYYELLYAVARKFPGESRHDTALRYIRTQESGSIGTANKCDTERPELVRIKE